MPNIASAKKNMRKTRAATVRNRAQRAALRTALKRPRRRVPRAEERVRGSPAAGSRGPQRPDPRIPRPATRAGWRPRGRLAPLGVATNDEKAGPLGTRPFRVAHLWTWPSTARTQSHCRELAPAPLAVPLGRVVHRSTLRAFERLDLLRRHVTEKQRNVESACGLARWRRLRQNLRARARATGGSRRRSAAGCRRAAPAGRCRGGRRHAAPPRACRRGAGALPARHGADGASAAPAGRRRPPCPDSWVRPPNAETPARRTAGWGGGRPLPLSARCRASRSLRCRLGARQRRAASEPPMAAATGSGRRAVAVAMLRSCCTCASSDAASAR